MKSDKQFPGKGRAWEPPTVTKLAIGTETKSPVAVGQGSMQGSMALAPQGTLSRSLPRRPPRSSAFH